MTRTARGPLDRTECDNGGSRDGLGASTEPSTENPTGPSAITAGRGAVIRCLTAKHQPGRAMTRRGRNLWSSGVRSGQLGSVSMPTASRARGFNPGHAPHHRGTAVTPPGLGRENPGGLGGPVCAAGRGCSPLQRTKGAPGGQGGNASGFFRRAVPIPSQGVGGWFFRERSKSPDRGPNRTRFLPKFTIVAGGSQLSHAMHWPDTFAQNSERTAKRVPSGTGQTVPGAVARYHCEQ